jgi:hypothetical protein
MPINVAYCLINKFPTPLPHQKESQTKGTEKRTQRGQGGGVDTAKSVPWLPAVAWTVQEEVWLVLQPDPDLVRCALEGDFPRCQERSVDCWATEDLTGKTKPDEILCLTQGYSKWTGVRIPFSPAISPAHPGEDLLLRLLCTADLNRNFF